MESKTCAAFERLNDILDTLRRECPWDRVQTLKSLRYLTIEEVHELSEAIVAREEWMSTHGAGETSDTQIDALNSQFKKELGDLAMHIMFYAKIAEEEGMFSQADVYNAICDKLIDRHPFIYKKDEYHGESWEQLKMREGRKSVLEGVPDTLPTLVKTVRMQEKVAGMRKGIPSAESDQSVTPSGQLHEGMDEAEFGDLLFSLVDWARSHGINADDALAGANYRFKQRFAAVEKK